ncbi:MAG: hypothetical protein ACLT3H_02810 [Roseburia sp.]
MGDQPIRIGKVSSINYESGMMRIVYNDKGSAVTKELPYMNFNDEYTMPKVGEQVVTAHLSNGNSRAIILGKTWDKKNTPAETGKGIYRKEFSRTRGSAYARYEDDTGVYYLVAGSVELTGINGIDISAPKVSISADTKITIDAEEAAGEAKIKKIVLETIEELTLKSGKDLMLEDLKWKTTLSKIMDRLSALDGDQSDKK